MARTKYHITPESGKMAITLSKRQIKEFKKMSIEFELSVDDLLQMAIESFIRRYQNVSLEVIDKKGIEAIAE